MAKNKRYIDGEEECVEDQFLIDTETDEYFYIDHGLDKIVKRLNDQEEEINTLKSLIIDDENELKELKKYKFAYNQLSSYVDANFDEYMTQKKLNERIRELEEENDNLKQRIKEETDRVIKLEQYVYTKLCPKSEHYNEKVVSAIINTILGDVE